MNNKTKTGIFVLAVFAISAMVLIGQNAVSNGFVVGGTKQSTTTNIIATSTTSTSTTSPATITTRPNTCTDTDGGFVTGTRGTVQGVALGRDYNYTDHCLNATALKEYACYTAKYSVQVTECSANLSCVDGACV